MKKIKSLLFMLGDYAAHLAVGFFMLVPLVLAKIATTQLIKHAAPVVDDVYFIKVLEFVDTFLTYADIIFLVWWSGFATYSAMKKVAQDFSEEKSEDE